MSLQLSVIVPGQADELLLYEQQRVRSEDPEQIFLSWTARWRKEALEYYLKLGWSFLARDDQQLVGYFLAQPLLFITGETQMSWVEHLQYSSLQARDELCALAYKLARDKHLQKVIFPDEAHLINSIKSLGGQSWQPKSYEIRTTKVTQ
jgi:hypothetical protein